MHSELSPSLEAKNKASTLNYLCTSVVTIEHGCEHIFNCFLRKKNTMHENEGKKKTYLNFRFHYFLGTNFIIHKKE